MKRIKMLAVALITLPLVALALFSPAPVSSSAVASAQDFDAAAVYKVKCAMCHGQKAEKKFDATKDDEAHVGVVLKGKDDVTPKMPGYEAKGVTPDQAKSLVTHMKSMK
ncbi:MAG TPA: cytochrome c [Pyrinomonadaceae bacterium]|nr:cytochrome c [Pyrinomonadaceae bacterium]